MSTRIAVSHHQALKTMWTHEWNTEELLRQANDGILKLPQPTPGYVYADDVMSLIDKLQKEQ